LKFGDEEIEFDLKVLCPDHVQSLKAEKNAIIAEIASRNAENGSQNADKVIIAIQTQWGPENQRTIEKPEQKVKVKTCATTEVGESSMSSTSEIEEEIKIEPLRISVSRGAFSIF
jgi:hypothetical protein